MKTKFLFIFLALATWAQAQHSYLTDRRFFTPDELIGYDFKPAVKEVPNERKEDLTPGQYSFGITHTNLYVKGEGMEGVYNINNMQPEDFGFKLTLMNARDARLQGHLKVILNKYNMVEALIFKRSPNDKETIFYMPAIPTKLRDDEKAFFTDRGELVIQEPDSIWGKKFYPFFRMHTQDRVQERLRMKDSTSISFVEEVTIEEKDVKKRKKDTDPAVVAAADSVAVGETAMPADSLGANPDKKVKITKEYFVVVRSIVQFEDGMREDKTWKHQVKRISEKEDKKAGMQEERYQWEFVNDKKDNIILYLNGDHTVSTMIINDKTYKMRGI
jgi:hypothetical protein